MKNKKKKNKKNNLISHIIWVFTIRSAYFFKPPNFQETPPSLFIAAVADHRGSARESLKINIDMNLLIDNYIIDQ